MIQSGQAPKVYFVLMLSGVLASVFMAQALYAQAEEEPIALQGVLTLETPQERALTSTSIHAWEMVLETGQYVEVQVEQQGIDIVVHVLNPFKASLGAIDSLAGGSGKEQAAWVAWQRGRWQVVVVPAKEREAGRYSIVWARQRTATDRDRRRQEADSLEAVASLYYSEGLYPDAEPLYRKALAIRERVLGHDHPEVATSLNNLARLYRTQGRYDEAEPLYRRALAIRERVLGRDHPEVATSLNNLATLYFDEGRYLEAEPLFQQALDLEEHTLGATHPRVATSLSNLGELYRAQGHYDEAEALFEQARDLFEQAFGPNHHQVAASLNYLALLYYDQGRYQEAASFFQQALKMRERALGSDHPDVAVTLNNLGGLYWNQGRYQEAEPLFQRARHLFEQAFGANHPNVAMTLNNLGQLYRDQGRYAEAEPLYRRALKMRERVLGSDHPDVAVTLNNLAMLSWNQGLYQEAEPLFQRALYLFEQAFGPDHLRVALGLNNLGGLYYDQGRYAEAEPLYRRALAIREQTLGPAHPDVAVTLNNLAMLSWKQERYQEAEPLFQRALYLFEQAFGPDHPHVAASRINLAWIYRKQDKDEPAMSLIEQAIETLDTTTGMPEARLIAYATRAQLRKQHGDLAGALTDLTEALRTAEGLRPQASGGEQTRALLFEHYTDLFDRMFAWQHEAGDIEQAFEYAERGRARVLLDQLAAGKIDLRASIPSDLRAGLERRETDAHARLAEYQQRITLLHTREDLPLIERLRRLGALQDSLRLAERDYKQVYAEIKNASPLWRDQITVGGRPVELATVQRRLAPKRGLMLIYQLGAEQSYLLVIPPGRQTVETLPLVVSEEGARVFGLEPGPLTAEAVAQIINGTDGRNGGAGGLLRHLGARRKQGGARSAFLVEEALHALWRVLIPEALTARLIETEAVVIVPDGALFSLPFEALIVEPAGAEDNGPRYWLDDGPVVRYAPSATVLATITQRPASRMAPLANTARVLSLSDAIFNPTEVDSLEAAQEQPSLAAKAPSVSMQPVTRDSYERVGGSLKRLPGTAQETAAIEAAYGSEADRALERLQGLEAREPRLRAALAQKRYLHLATHGLVDERRGALFASLALTPPPGETTTLDDDGFLQLHEIYALKLPDVELAVLSACATNVGETVEGEGVFALSRGFLVAGARRVIASQWSVDDASTAALMQSLFEAIVASERAGRAVDYGRALRDARRAVRSQAPWSDPYYWAPFILTGKQ